MKERVAERIELAHFLITRLERLSPDSGWARRVSGARGAILKLVEEMEHNDVQEVDLARLEHLIDWSFDLLARAAREIPEEEES